MDEWAVGIRCLKVWFFLCFYSTNATHFCCWKHFCISAVWHHCLRAVQVMKSIAYFASFSAPSCYFPCFIVSSLVGSIGQQWIQKLGLKKQDPSIHPSISSDLYSKRKTYKPLKAEKHAKSLCKWVDLLKLDIAATAHLWNWLYLNVNSNN